MDLAGNESCSSPSSSIVSTNGTGLNLLCSALDQRPDLMDSSNSSEASTSPSPSQCGSSSSHRRDSNIDCTRDEAYWEKRRRNNDAAKRCREKRKISDIVIEQRLIELTKENTLLKNRLQQQQGCQAHRTPIQSLSHHESVIVAAPKYETPSLPAPSITAYSDYINSNSKFQAVFPQFLAAANPLLASSSTATVPTATLPVLHLSHLQAALQAQPQYRPTTAQISSGNGAFQPFQSTHENTVRQGNPDSSTVDVLPTDYSYEESSPELRDLPSYCFHSSDMSVRDNDGIDGWSNNSDSSQHEYLDSEQQRPQSLLELLSTRRPSPLVPETRTDIHSGLINTSSRESDLKNCLSSLNVHLCANKSDIDSMGSPNSNHSTTDSAHSFLSQPSPTSGHPNAAIVKALTSRPTNKNQQQYIDRRRRNNEAAKRCRANRRAQFELRSRRAQQLEQENEELRKEMSKLRQELEQLKALHAAKNATILRQ